MNKIEVPLLYIFLYKTIKEKKPREIYVKPREIRQIISRIFRIPKETHYNILSELETFKLIKRMNHQKYRILKSNCDNIFGKNYENKNLFLGNQKSSDFWDEEKLFD